MTRSRILFICSVLFVCSSAIAQRVPIPQQLTFTPYHSNGIYKIGETVGWTVTPGPDAPTYAYKWTVRRNNAVVLEEGKLDLSSGKDKIEIAGDQPEMIYVAIEPYGALAAAPTAPSASGTSAGQSGSAPPNQNGPTPDAASTAAAQSGSTAANSGGSTQPPQWIGGNTGRNNGLYAVGAAVAPTEIPLSTPRPADFDAFWDGKLALQAKVPLDAMLTPVPNDVPGVEMSMFALDALGSKAHGYVARPIAEASIPR